MFVLKFAPKFWDLILQHFFESKTSVIGHTIILGTTKRILDERAAFLLHNTLLHS